MDQSDIQLRAMDIFQATFATGLRKWAEFRSFQQGRRSLGLEIFLGS
jgi:hypothetical protein